MWLIFNSVMGYISSHPATNQFCPSQSQLCWAWPSSAAACSWLFSTMTLVALTVCIGWFPNGNFWRAFYIAGRALVVFSFLFFLWFIISYSIKKENYQLHPLQSYLWYQGFHLRVSEDKIKHIKPSLLVNGPATG